MTKFIFKTLTKERALYPAPSGHSYRILKGQPFEVKNEQDINFFEKKSQFKKYSLLDSLKPKKSKKSEDEVFKKELKSKTKLSEDSINKVINVYVNQDSLIKVYENKLNYGSEFTEKEVEELNKFLNNKIDKEIKGYIEKEIKKENPVKESKKNKKNKLKK